MQRKVPPCSGSVRRLRSPFVALSIVALSVVAGIVRAQEQRHIRITVARSVSGIPLWGIGPFAEKAGFQVEYIPAGTNAEMQRNLQSGVEIGTLGYQSPAVMAEQNVGNVKIVAGEQQGLQNLIMRKGVELKSWKELEGRKIGRPPGSYAAILFTLAARENSVDSSRVNLVNTTSAGPAELQALKSGDLDGLVLWSPLLSACSSAGPAECRIDEIDLGEIDPILPRRQRKQDRHVASGRTADALSFELAP